MLDQIKLGVQVNHSYSIFKIAFDYYTQHLKVYGNGVPDDVKKFMNNLLYINSEYQRLFDILGKIDIQDENKQTSSLLMGMLYVQVKSLDISSQKENIRRTIIAIRFAIKECADMERNIAKYIQSNPVVDLSAQEIVLNSTSLLEVKRTETFEHWRIEYLIIYGISALVIAALGTILLVDDYNKEDSWWIFSLFFLLCFIPMGAISLFAPKDAFDTKYHKRNYNKRGKRTSSFWSIPKGRSITAGWKIKKYDPTGWRKKNWDTQFKRSGRKAHLF